MDLLQYLLMNRITALIKNSLALTAGSQITLLPALNVVYEIINHIRDTINDEQLQKSIIGLQKQNEGIEKKVNAILELIELSNSKSAKKIEDALNEEFEYFDILSHLSRMISTNLIKSVSLVPNSKLFFNSLDRIYLKPNTILFGKRVKLNELKLSELFNSQKQYLNKIDLSLSSEEVLPIYNVNRRCQVENEILPALQNYKQKYGKKYSIDLISRRDNKVYVSITTGLTKRSNLVGDNIRISITPSSRINLFKSEISVLNNKTNRTNNYSILKII